MPAYKLTRHLLMKRIHFLLAALLFISVTVSAQTNDSTLKGMQRDILKINVLSLPLKNVSVQYEYILKKKISLALGLRVMPSTAIPFKSVVRNIVGTDGDEDSDSVINVTRLSNIAFTPEVRFWLGKGYGQGFYIAPYYRFVRFVTNTGIINYSANGGGKKSVQLNGDLNAHNIGVMIGFQKFFGKQFSIDWWIAGIHLGHSSGNFTGRPSQSITEAEQADIRYTIDNINIPFIHKTHTVTANSVDVQFGGAFGGLRAGFCFGVRL